MSTLSDSLATIEANKEAAAARARAEAERVAAAYRRAFNTTDGKLVFADLRRRFVDVPIARPGYSADHAFYREGRRSVVAFIYQLIEATEGFTDDDGRKSGTAGAAGEGAAFGFPATED